MYVLRHALVHSFHAPLIERAAHELSRITLYQRSSLCEEAPEKADCLTAIHYIFKKALGIHLSIMPIGDMPRHLASLSDWRILKIDIRDARCGDLLFMKSKERTILLSHAALYIKTDQIFHCTLRQQKASIDTEEEFFKYYEQELTFKEMLSYIDIRNTELRAKYRGIFVT